jgi:hypothetical protein
VSEKESFNRLTEENLSSVVNVTGQNLTGIIEV